MDKRMQAIANLIKALMEAHSDMVDMVTSKPKDIFTEKERTKMFINELYVGKAIDDIAKYSKEILERGDKHE